MQKTYSPLSIGALIATAAILMSMPRARAERQMMDFFTTTPLVGTLSADCWGAKEVGPRDQSNGLEDRTLAKYVYWDGGIIKGDDGLYHMFASRWDQSGPHNWSWTNSVAIHATSPDLYGPYTDQGICWPDNQGGKGHNIFPLKLKDGRYAIVVSDTRPGEVFVAASLNGPWKELGKIKVTQNEYADLFQMYNVSILLRPDGRYEAVTRHGAVALADEITGPYTVQGPSLWTRVAMPKGNIEDPLIWYSGGLYHVVVNKWDARKAFHLTSKNGVDGWTLQPGAAYVPTADFVRYADETVNRWNKIERPNVYLEDGHVVAFTFAVINSPKEEDMGNDRNGSKVIVVPFDGKALDRDLAAAEPQE